ncbi:uncharacterized protein LOC129250032 [Anastrepha obliqua]|uniref:uncharacterized protein LOC129250032 n=1 Tax=Anastrepha obliqua TaxID=95512 RepID=UPI002409808E|nr:uncharacterized protein LOC129250032 [Anastrepha obliqua]
MIFQLQVSRFLYANDSKWNIVIIIRLQIFEWIKTGSHNKQQIVIAATDAQHACPADYMCACRVHDANSSWCGSSMLVLQLMCVRVGCLTLISKIFDFHYAKADNKYV